MYIQNYVDNLIYANFLFSYDIVNPNRYKYHVRGQLSQSSQLSHQSLE